MLQAARAGDIGEARGVEFVMQVAAPVEQLEFQLRQFGQVVRAEDAVAEDQMARDATRVAYTEAAQVAHDLLHRRGVGLDAPTAVFAGIRRRFIAYELEQIRGIGRRRREAHGQRVQLGRQLDLRAHQHQHVRQAPAPLQDVAQLPLRARVAEVGMEIEQQIDAALVGVADRLQRRARVGRHLRGILAIEVDAPQSFRDRPAVQRAPHVQERLPEQCDDIVLVGRLDDDQRRVGADQRDEILQLAHSENATLNATVMRVPSPTNGVTWCSSHDGNRISWPGSST